MRTTLSRSARRVLPLLLVSWPAVATAQLRIEPAAAAPGDVVRLSSDQALPDRRETLVLFAGQATGITGQPVERALDVLVPLVPPGATVVEVRSRDQRVRVTGNLTVLPPRTIELLVALGGGTPLLVGTRPAAGDSQRLRVAAERRLSFDVVNARGGLAFTGDIPSPFAPRREVHGGAGGKDPPLRQIADRRRSQVVIRVPNVPRPFVVRFFDVADGVDLDTEDGRRARRPIGEVTVKAVQP